MTLSLTTPNHLPCAILHEEYQYKTYKHTFKNKHYCYTLMKKVNKNYGMSTLFTKHLEN